MLCVVSDPLDLHQRPLLFEGVLKSVTSENNFTVCSSVLIRPTKMDAQNPDCTSSVYRHVGLALMRVR